MKKAVAFLSASGICWWKSWNFYPIVARSPLSLYQHWALSNAAFCVMVLLKTYIWYIFTTILLLWNICIHWIPNAKLYYNNNALWPKRKYMKKKIGEHVAYYFNVLLGCGYVWGAHGSTCACVIRNGDGGWPLVLLTSAWRAMATLERPST